MVMVTVKDLDIDARLSHPPSQDAQLAGDILAPYAR